MNREKTMFHVSHLPFYRGLSVFIDRLSNGTTPVVGYTGKMVFTEVLEPFKPDSEPTLTLEQDEAQELFDQLWHCGLRPSDEVGSVGQLKATENHLADMRTLVFGRPKSYKVDRNGKIT